VARPVKVARGQLWSILNSAHMRVEVRVERIVGALVHLRGKGDRPFETKLRRSLMERGMRGCRLVKASDPWSLEERMKSVRITRAEKRTASEVRKVSGPKGVARASDADRQAARLVEGGLSYEEVAVKLTESLGEKVTKSRVRLMVERVRHADYDARAMKALGGS
jgi:hypothetical protein